MTILNIETSTSCCSAAISIDGVCVASSSNLAGANHARELPVFVEQLLSEARAQAWQLDAVALSEGPGSYTGLRIGASMAKGICYGQNIPLIPIDTLQVLCASVQPAVVSSALLCPMIDARRMEVYTALYRPDGLCRIGEVEAKIIDEEAFALQLQQHPIYFFGDGATKCRTMISSENAHFLDGVYPQAQYMGALAEKKEKVLSIKEIAYYEPFYLKEFVAAPCRIKGLK